MDAVDTEIIEALTANARVSFRALGARVALSPNAVAARVRRLELSGVIEGYTIVSGADAPAPSGPAAGRLEVFIDVRLNADTDFETFATRVDALRPVRDVVHVTGPFDALLHAVVEDTTSLDLFLAALKREAGASQTHTRVALRGARPAAAR